MRRIITLIISTVVLLCSCCLLACDGCFDDGSRKHMNDFMVEIETELSGYNLIKVDSSIDAINYNSGDFIYKNSNISLEFNHSGYIVIYKEKEYIVNDSFLKEYSETYNKIHQMWDKNSTGKSEIISIYVLDDLVFIITTGIKDRVYGGVKGMFPYTLYQWNISAETINYVDWWMHDDLANSGEYWIAIEKTHE